LDIGAAHSESDTDSYPERDAESDTDIEPDPIPDPNRDLNSDCTRDAKLYPVAAHVADTPEFIVGLDTSANAQSNSNSSTRICFNSARSNATTFVTPHSAAG
jgi:hypothetical protein